MRRTLFLAALLALALLPAPAAATPSPCADGIDNDADGHTDHPDDPDCDGPDDETEGGPPACSDGIDNDADGPADYPEDPDCASYNDDRERAPSCRDGIDNDADGRTDHPEDAGCSDPEDDQEASCQPADPAGCGGTAPCTGVLLPPTLLQTRREADGVRLDWEPPLAGEPVGYFIHRIGVHALGPQGPLQVSVSDPLDAVPPWQTSYFDSTVRPGTDYAYWITSVAEGCQSSASNLMSSGGGLLPDLAQCVYLDFERTPPEPTTLGTKCLNGRTGP